MTCTYCGFPMDTPKRAHDFIHHQGEALIEHRKLVTTLRRLLRSCREELHPPIPGETAALCRVIDEHLGPYEPMVRESSQGGDSK